MSDLNDVGAKIAAISDWVDTSEANARTDASEATIAELLDTALAALGAVEHLTGNFGLSMQLLCEKVDKVHARAQHQVESEIKPPPTFNSGLHLCSQLTCLAPTDTLIKGVATAFNGTRHRAAYCPRHAEMMGGAFRADS